MGLLSLRRKRLAPLVLALRHLRGEGRSCRRGTAAASTARLTMAAAQASSSAYPNTPLASWLPLPSQRLPRRSSHAAPAAAGVHARAPAVLVGQSTGRRSSHAAPTAGGQWSSRAAPSGSRTRRPAVPVGQPTELACGVRGRRPAELARGGAESRSRLVELAVAEPRPAQGSSCSTGLGRRRQIHPARDPRQPSHPLFGARHPRRWRAQARLYRCRGRPRRAHLRPRQCLCAPYCGRPPHHAMAETRPLQSPD